MLELTALLLGAYLLGSIPAGYIVGKLVSGIDIREHGSGNPGATNVFRIVGPGYGTFVFIFDALKGLIPVIGAKLIFAPDASFYPILAGIIAILGHIFSVFLRFRGGKGVSTGAGVFLGLMPGFTLIGAVVFAASLLLTKYVSAASLVAAFTVAVLPWLAGATVYIKIFTVMVLFIVLITHASNIKRLINGNENKFPIEEVTKCLKK